MDTKSLSYEAINYSGLIGSKGFSDDILNNHFKLYQGYVTNTNKVLGALGKMLKDGDPGSPEYAELKRRLGWEFNGMRLHEYYFENLGGDGSIDKGKLADALASSFGSLDAWARDFKATGMMRGIGWVALYQDTATGKMMNFWINEHDVSHPAGGNLVIVMDVFEHAFMLDYGLKKAEYIEAFFKNLDWKKAESRLKRQ